MQYQGGKPLPVSSGWITQQRLTMNGLKSPAQISHRQLLRRPGPAVAIATAAALFATVIGCGHKSSTATPSQTPGASGTSSSAAPTAAPSPQAAQLVQDAAKATTALHSLHVNLTTMDITTLPMESVDADVTNLPQGNGQAVGSAMVRLQPKAPAIAKDFLVTNKTMYTKNSSGAYTSVGPAEKIYDPGIILDKDKGLGHVISQVQNPQMAGSETVNGIATMKVTGTVDGAVIDPVVPQLGKGATTLPITLYITDVNAAGGGTTATSASAGAQPQSGEVGGRQGPGPRHHRAVGMGTAGQHPRTQLTDRRELRIENRPRIGPVLVRSASEAGGNECPTSPKFRSANPFHARPRLRAAPNWPTCGSTTGAPTT